MPTAVMMLDNDVPNSKPRVVGYLCELCVAEAKGESWHPEMGDQVRLCKGHYDVYFELKETVIDAMEGVE